LRRNIVSKIVPKETITYLSVSEEILRRKKRKENIGTKDKEDIKTIE